MPRLLKGVCIVLIGAVAAAAASAGAAPDASRRAELANLLEQDCGSCHGLTRAGGLGTPLTPAALSDRDDAHLRRVILDGIPGTAMPGWRPLLAPGEADYIVQLLRKGPK